MDKAPDTQRTPGGQQQPYVFNRSWLWFALGIFFAFIGVIASVLLTLNQPPEQRNAAIRYSAWGMLIGIAIEAVLLFALGGPEALSNMFWQQELPGSSSTTGIF